MILEITASAIISWGSAPTRGSSDIAWSMFRQTQEQTQDLQESYSIGFAGIREEISTVAMECDKADWDGFGAAPVSAESVRYSFRVIEALPLGTPRPSIGAEPDGQITLEWHHSPRRTLSVSISPDGDLHYAALLGPNKSYGTEVFLGDIPKTILDLIHQVSNP